MSGLDDLIERGGPRVREHATFGALTTYRVGGTVRVLVTITSRADLDELGPLIEGSDRPIVMLGNGSNLLVADGELDVVGVRLSGEFESLSWRDEDDAVSVEAGAALDLPVVARRLAKEGIVGFEWAVGVPGTIGGAVVMNAGGHGSNMAASVERVDTWRGGHRVWSLHDLHYGYRTSTLESGQIVLAATLRLSRGDATESLAQIREIVHWRREHQPGGANAGSVFRNPPGLHAGALIEEAGMKGARVGGAVVSEKHANFILVEDDATASDVYQLLCLVRDRVEATSGIELITEHHLVGFGVDP